VENFFGLLGTVCDCFTSCVVPVVVIVVELVPVDIVDVSDVSNGASERHGDGLCNFSNRI